MLVKKTTMLLAGAALLGSVSFVSVASAQDFSRGVQLSNTQMESVTAAGHNHKWKKYLKIVKIYYKKCGHDCDTPPAPPAPAPKGENTATAAADSTVKAPDTYDTDTFTATDTKIVTKDGRTHNSSSSVSTASSGPAAGNDNDSD